MRPLFKYKYYVIILAVAGFWLFLIMLPPLLVSLSIERSSLFLYFVFSPLCHQIAERSFFLRGYPLPVCSRCFGVYSGLLLGILIFPLIRGNKYMKVIDRRYLFIAAFPIMADVILMSLGIYPSNRWTRFFSGLGFGSILAFFALPAFFQMTFLLLRRGGIRNLLR